MRSSTTNHGTIPALVLVLVLAHVLAPAPARAAAQGCEAGAWLPTTGPLDELDGPVRALATLSGDHAGAGLYAAWERSATMGSISRWDGHRWSRIADADGHVLALLTVEESGGPVLYAGGGFVTMGSVPASRVARLDAGGWTALGGGTNGLVRALVLHDDGSGRSLFAAGSFTQADGLATGTIARWDGTSWSGVGGGTVGPVEALAVFDEGAGPRLFVGGGMSMVGGQPIARLARWDGTSWSSLGGTSHAVRCFAIHDDGGGPALYVGGSFTVAGGVGASRIARWDGSSWSPVGDGLSAGAVESLLSQVDATGMPRLVAGGAFLASGPVPMKRIASWDGARWSGLGLGFEDSVRSLASVDFGAGPVLYAAGAFTSSGMQPVRRIARWNGLGWNPVTGGLDGIPFVFADIDEGPVRALYVGGTFQTVGGLPAHHVARWDGERWRTLGRGTDGTVRAIAGFDAGQGVEIYAAGDFKRAGDIDVEGLARWDGHAWSVVGGGLGGLAATLPVNALVAHDDGSGPALYVGGAFASAGGVTVSNLARWDGASWSRPGSESLSAVYSLAVFDDGAGAGPQLYAGTLGALRRWDGSAWTTIASMASYAAVRGMVARSSEPLRGLFLHGGFTLATPTGTAFSIARWDGLQFWALGSIGGVHDVEIFDLHDGRGPSLYAGGSFALADNFLAERIARWDGTRWWGMGSGFETTVHALGAFESESPHARGLYVGGGFLDSAIGDAYLTRWACPGGSTGSAFCFGDGTDGPCPCANTGQAGRGCDNALGTGGVVLTMPGEPSTNSVIAVGEGFPPFSLTPAILLRSGTARAAPTSFGDGLSCLSGNAVRVGTALAHAGRWTHPVTHAAGAGNLHYQLWYRSSGAFCTPAAFNTSNAYTIVWP